MTQKLNLILRCCEDDQKAQYRPHWFSKVGCLKNLYATFGGDFVTSGNVILHAIHDGPIGPVYDLLQEYKFTINKFQGRTNESSLVETLGYVSGIQRECGGTFIYFVEDDYIHNPKNGYSGLVEGFGLLKSNSSLSFLSLYDCSDRYTRTDDIDYGRTNVYVGGVSHWRTAESTTCTWAIAQEDYMEFGYNLAMKHRLNDRALFREALTMGKRLITPMPGLSTHCHIPFMSPTINWAMYT